MNHAVFCFVWCVGVLPLTCESLLADEAKLDPTEQVRVAASKNRPVKVWAHLRTAPYDVRLPSNERPQSFRLGDSGTQAMGISTPDDRPTKTVPAQSVWNVGDKEPQKGELFRVAIGPGSNLFPAFRCSQILSKTRFLDLDHGFLVEGIDTQTLSDGDWVEKRSDGFRISEMAGVVVGPFQYDTRGGGKKTVLHILLSPHPDFLISDEEASEGWRLWTAVNGVRVVAKIASKRGSSVRLTTRERKVITVKLAELSAEDREFAENWKK